MVAITEQVKQQVEPIIAFVQANPVVVAIGLGVVGLAYIVYKQKTQPVEEKEYEPTDWETKIPEELKKLARKTGTETEKQLWIGDRESKGMVFAYSTGEMPEDIDYMEYLFGDFDSGEESGEVYIFAARPEGTIDKYLWKVTDSYGNDSKTEFFIVDKEYVDEERDRFVINPDIDFKIEYGKVFVQKGMKTEAVTDQFPLYQARKNIVEGIEEFSMKTLFLDRKHSSQVAQMREDVDEEALKRLLGQGKDF